MINNNTKPTNLKKKMTQSTESITFDLAQKDAQTVPKPSDSGSFIPTLRTSKPTPKEFTEEKRLTSQMNEEDFKTYLRETYLTIITPQVWELINNFIMPSSESSEDYTTQSYQDRGDEGYAISISSDESEEGPPRKRRKTFEEHKFI